MFCLRIWLLPLFFLSTAPPLYLLLFLTATYILQRPCVYCSLLLFVLVLALFDFSGSDWFEARANAPPLAHHFNNTSTASSLLNDLSNLNLNAGGGAILESLGGIFGDAMGLAMAAVNGTAAGLMEVAKEVVHEKLQHAGDAAAEVVNVSAPNEGWVGRLGVEWARGVWRRGEIRIPCVNAVIRL